MNAERDWKQGVVDALFVAAEAIAWYVMFRVAATAVEQALLTQMADRLQLAVGAAELADGAGRATEALRVIQRAAQLEHGPSILVVLITAFGGFALMRLLQRWKIEGALGAIVVIATSVLALNVLMHVALIGDLRVWDPSGLATAFNTNDLSESGELEAFVRRPVLTGPHASTVTFIFGGMTVLWVRFLMAGRSRVTFERVLRSFTVGFVVTILGLALAAMEGIARVQLFAVPQFVIGMLALAVANNARAVAPIDGPRRTGPWIASVGGTIAVLLFVALLLSTLAFLNVGALLSLVGDLAWAVITFLLIIIITPIYWVMERLVRWLLPNGLVQWPQLPNLALVEPDPNATEQASKWFVPLWAQDGLRFIAVAIVAYVIYRIALRLMRRSRSVVTAVDEVRGHASTSMGLGGLLRGLLPGAKRASGDDWLRLHAIYRLFARAAKGAEERGFRYLPGETPLEFAHRADRAMDGQPFPPISLAFDRARYGRHYPEDGQVRAMEAALASWEAATPPTEELRHRLAGAAPLDDSQELMLRMVSNRRIIKHAQPNPEDNAERIQRPLI